jgi:phosphotransferase system IIB component
MIESNDRYDSVIGGKQQKASKRIVFGIDVDNEYYKEFIKELDQIIKEIYERTISVHL